MRLNSLSMLRRFRVRFGLRSALIFVALIAILLAWIASERRQSQHERQIAEQLREAGFTFRFGGSYDSYELYQYDKPQGWWRDWARTILGERVLATSCDQYSEFSDLTIVAQFTSLQELDISSSNVTDLSPLSTLHELRFLGIVETEVSDLAPLAGLAELRDLWMAETKVVDFAPLAGLKKLEFLEFDSDHPISDQQKAMLHESLPNLKSSPVLEDESQIWRRESVRSRQ